MQVKLLLDVSYENGVLVLTSSTGRKLVFPASHEVQKKLEMVTLGELSELTIKEVCHLFNFKTRKSYYDIRRCVLENDIEKLLPRKPGPKRLRKRTPEMEKRVIQLRLTTDQNMYQIAETLRKEDFKVSARLVAEVLADFGISKKKITKGSPEALLESAHTGAGRSTQ